jgi:hypothetical protein
VLQIFEKLISGMYVFDEAQLIFNKYVCFSLFEKNKILYVFDEALFGFCQTRCSNETKRNETIQKRLGGSRCVLLFQFAHGKPRTGDKFSQRLSKTLVPPRKVAKATTTLSSGAAHNLARPYLNRICSIGSYRCILYYKGGKHSSLVDDL